MKATTQLSFKDKETQRQYKPGDIFESTPERIEEINKALKGALKIINEIKVEAEIVTTEEKSKRKKRSKKQ